MKAAIYWLQLLSIASLWLNASFSQEVMENENYSDTKLFKTKSITLKRNLNEDLNLSDNIEDHLLRILISDTRNNKPLCRSSNERKLKDVVLPIGLFGLDSCARCYGYILDVPAFFEPFTKWNRTEISIRVPSLLIKEELSYNIAVLQNEHLNVTELADHENMSSLFRTSFRTENALERWVSCCDAAVKCCESMTSRQRHHREEVTENSISEASDQRRSDSNATCPSLWDGWTCWHTTETDRLALSQCPNYIYFDSEPPLCPRYARRYCNRDGNWSPRKDSRSATNKKTDYLPCGEMLELKKRATVHIIAYGISVVALIPALLIFYSYKQLNVYRIRLHKNLFMSILLNAIWVIIFKAVVIMPTFSPQRSNVLSLIRQNALICRLLLILTRYLRLTNYMWMFCEGFYLHRLIAAAFAEQKSFAIFYLIGWGFPLIPTCLYATVRALWYDDRCWMEPIENWEWVLNAPCLLALLVNTIFLFNIIRILVNKLRTSTHAGNEPSQYRKAVRATLVLVPLFGLHFILTIYRPPRGGCEWIEFYQYLNILLDGLQGILVAITFCYGNGEVHYLVKRSYKRFREERGVTQSNPNQIPFSGSTAVGGLGTCRSALIGRSTGSLTHFSVADGSPNPTQKPLAMVHLADNVASRSTNGHSKASNGEMDANSIDFISPKASQKANRAQQNSPTRMSEDLLISETCLE